VHELIPFHNKEFILMLKTKIAKEMRTLNELVKDLL